jgi:DNA-binding NarL/FixJ family response regulator
MRASSSSLAAVVARDYDAATVTQSNIATRPRVLLAEDQAGNLALLQALLESEFEVIGTAQDGEALVAAAARLCPDVVVTDIGMPILDGIAAAAQILRKSPGTRVVFVTVHTDPTLVRRGLAVGGLGYVCKLTAGDELVPAVWAAVRGERWCLCNL